MARSHRKSKFLEMGEIAALRKMLLYLRQDSELELSRDDIATEAGVSAADLDNFIGQKQDGSFKTQVPREQFQRRLLAYILASNFFTDEKFQPVTSVFEYDPREDVPKGFTSEQRALMDLGRYREEFNRKYNTIPIHDFRSPKRTRTSLYRFETQDRMFDLLSALKLISEASAKDLCEDLAGGYYAYRFSSIRNVIHKSYVRIEKYDVYSKTPRYVSNFREPGIKRTIRITEGSIFEIGKKYILIGQTKLTDHRPPLGINLSVLHNMGIRQPKTLSGFYVSCDRGGNYNVGNVKFVSTDERFSETDIGDIAELPRGVTAEDLSIDILGLSELLGSVASRALFDRGKIPRSIKYYATKPRLQK